jgi:hypothetical protein
MKISPIILRIRTAETALGQRVGGVADLNAVTEETFQTGLPLGYVLHLGDLAVDNDNDTGTSQLVRDRIGVVVCMDNRNDKQGLKAHDEADDIRVQIDGAILAWTPPGYETAIEYRGSSLVEMNRAYLWWMYEYSADRRLTELDGVDPEDIYGPWVDFLRFWGYIQATHTPFTGVVDFTVAEPPSPVNQEVWLNMGTGNGSVTGQPVVKNTVYSWDIGSGEWQVVPFDVETLVELPQ